MRIMLDTNVLISALLFPGTRMDTMMNNIFMEHKLVLSSYVCRRIEEGGATQISGERNCCRQDVVKNEL